MSPSSSRRNNITTAFPLYLTVNQMEDVLVKAKATMVVSPPAKTNSDRIKHNNIDDGDEVSAINNDNSKEEEEPLVAWVGRHQDADYWAVYLKDDDIQADNDGEEENGSAEPKLLVLESILTEVTSISTSEETTEFLPRCKPLREFGDSLASSLDAAVLATANGLVEFHKSHGYCSSCGEATKPSKAGSCRTCSNEGCVRSVVYPRIDSATIMLVTSPCEGWALLGRKRSWPAGRYSTLAGFCEVGETLEECLARETLEESGVVVDPASVRFVASQPWPFPRSLMVGFRAAAAAAAVAGEDPSERSSSLTTTTPSSLPEITVDASEMEDIRWFPKHFVKERLSSSDGSTALTYEPDDAEAEFHVPGKASLARRLIAEWADE